MFQQACRNHANRKTLEEFERRSLLRIKEEQGKSTEEEFIDRFAKNVGGLPEDAISVSPQKLRVIMSPENSKDSPTQSMRILQS